MLWALVILALAQPTLTPASEEADAGEKFRLESKLRAGILIGNPLSITIATDLSDGLVFQLDLGLSPSRSFSGIIGMDVAYRSEEIFGRVSADLWLMPFFGLGIRGAVGEGEQDDRFGFRLPVGITLISELEPIEVYVQVAPGFSLFPDRRGSIDAGGGVRVGF